MLMALCIELHMVDLMTKPVDIDHLFNCISYCLVAGRNEAWSQKELFRACDVTLRKAIKC